MSPLRTLLRDVLALAGVGLIGAGLWLLHPAAACLTAGGLLFTTAVFVMRRR